MSLLPPHRVLTLSAETISTSDDPKGLPTQRLGTPDPTDTFPSLYSAEVKKKWWSSFSGWDYWNILHILPGCPMEA